MHGFYGRYLNIDLGKKDHSIETLNDDVYETYLGGKGLASYLLYELNPPGVDPLSAENTLIFATGPLSGSTIWGSCRYGVYTKSPLTGFFADSRPGRPLREADARTPETAHRASAERGRAPRGHHGHPLRLRADRCRRSPVPPGGSDRAQRAAASHLPRAW